MKRPEVKWGVNFDRHWAGFALGTVLCVEKVNGEQCVYLNVMLGLHTLVLGRYAQ